MEHDLAADLLRLVGRIAGRIGGAGRRAIRAGPIEPPHVDIGYGDGLRRKTIGGDEHMCATRRRLDDDRTTLPVEPAVAASGGADDFSTSFRLIPQRGNVHRGHLEAGHLAEHARDSRRFRGRKDPARAPRDWPLWKADRISRASSPASRRSARSGWSELNGSRFFLDLREYRLRPLSIRAASQLTRKPDAFVNPAPNNQVNRLSI